MCVFIKDINNYQLSRFARSPYIYIYACKFCRVRHNIYLFHFPRDPIRATNFRAPCERRNKRNWVTLRINTEHTNFMLPIYIYIHSHMLHIYVALFTPHVVLRSLELRADGWACISTILNTEWSGIVVN